MFIIVLTIGALCPIAGICLSIFYFTTYRRPIRSALLCGISFSALFYGYIADKQNDIYRHMEDLNYYTNVNIFHCFNVVESARKASIYVWDIWCWIIAQFHHPYLLQASGAFVGYALISYIVFDYANEISAKMKEWLPVLLALYCVIQPAGIAIGIRNSAASLLCCLSLYLFYIKRKNLLVSIIPIILGIFIHHSAIIILILWAVFPLYKKKKIVSILVISALLLIFNDYGSYLSVLSGHQFALSDIATDLVYSANNYQNFYHLWSLSNIVNFLIAFAMKIILLISTKNVAAEDNESKDLWSICFLIFWVSCILVLLIGVNGSRYFTIITVLLFILTMKQAKTGYFLVKDNFVLITAPLILLILVSFWLNNRNLSWGTASFSSLLLSSITGYFSRII